MVVDTTRESVCVNQIVGQKNENKIIEGDMIVPDIKPDILNTIETNGNICIYKKEVQDGKVKVDGKECIKVSLLNKNATDRIEKDYYYINLEDNNVLKDETYIGTDKDNLEKEYESNYTYSFDTVTDEDMLHFDKADFPDYQIFEDRTIGTRHFVRIHHNR